jgi:hypothetical protein
MSNIVSDDQVSKALDFLSTTDRDCAVKKALMKGLEHQRHTQKSLAMLDAETKSIHSGEKLSVSKKETLAFTSDRYVEFLQKYETSVVEYETINNQRHYQIGLIEVWRSEQANRRKGNI